MSDESAAGTGEGATPVEMTTPWRRDLGEVGERLAAWARAQVAPEAVVTDAASPGNGTTHNLNKLWRFLKQQRLQQAMATG